MTKILLFSGSARRLSLNQALIHQAADMVRAAGAEATVLDLGALHLPLYNADLESQGTPAGALQLKELMYAHPGWIIASPEYNGSITALLKNAIDWASSPAKQGADCSSAQALEWNSGTRPFAGKVVGLLSAAPGLMGGLRSLDHLVPTLRNLQCWITPLQFALGKAGEAFDEHGRLKNQQYHEKTRAVVQQVIHGASRLHA